MTTTVNLGIVAHVDAGKTSLTERLLYAAGVIDRIGRVDDGTTRTDSLALERERGITIKSAVACFDVGDVTVNLIDTPGHPDFIAEVERVLSVLDGAVLVVSAVEGVQPQTRILMRTLRRLRIPTVIFVNKIDRAGARPGRVLRELSEKLSPAVIDMASAHEPGTRGASVETHDASHGSFVSRLLETLTQGDDALLAEYVDDETAVTYPRLRASLAQQVRQALVFPVFYGSAVTGVGVDELVAGVTELLPAAEADADGPVSGTVFAIERGPGGEKIACIRLFSGTVRVRERLRFGAGREAKVTAITGTDARAHRTAVTAGQIGRVWGLGEARVGDAVGETRSDHRRGQHFAPPTLEAVVVPSRHSDNAVLHAALMQLADQDPLINLRLDGVRQEILLSLYGEVQKEVIQTTLAAEFGVDVTFRETTTVCIERPVGIGEAVEFKDADETNPFLATVGLRVEPAPVGNSVTFGLDVELGSMPYAFIKAVEETARESLQQGLYGWQVPDCIVTMTHSGYYARQSHAHGTFDKSMSSTAGDFRRLTPLVLMTALRQAGTRVCEPIHRFHLECPADALGRVLPALSKYGAIPQTTRTRRSSAVVEGEIPAARVHALQQRLPTLTHGAGMLEAEFGHYEAVRGAPPVRQRTDHNPLDRKEYLLHVVRRV